jgi:hypothetical protein
VKLVIRQNAVLVSAWFENEAIELPPFSVIVWRAQILRFRRVNAGFIYVDEIPAVFDRRRVA